MIYVKKQFEDMTIKFDLYEDEVFSSCPVCGKEHSVEPEELADLINQGNDFSGTIYYCNECAEKKKAELYG